MPPENTAETIADLAVAAVGASTVKTVDGREFLIVPEKSTFKEVTDPHGLYARRPSYIHQAVTVQTAESLVAYVNRFKGEDTILFADIMASSIAAKIDFHGPDKAAHVAHSAMLTLPFSEEWRTWTSISGHLKDQLEFARFIEENAADIAAPSGGDLLDAVRDIQARRKVNFTKAVRTASDNESFEYQEETTATTKKGELELPTKFLLKIPVYFGESDTEVFAFLRWRLDDGSLRLGVQLHRAEHIRQAVFRQIMLGVSEQTGSLVVFGKA